MASETTWKLISSANTTFRYKTTPVSCNMVRINWVLAEKSNARNIGGSFLVRDSYHFVRFLRNEGVSYYSGKLIAALDIAPSIRASSISNLRKKYNVPDSVSIPAHEAYKFCRTYDLLREFVGDNAKYIPVLYHLLKVNKKNIKIFIDNFGWDKFLFITAPSPRTSPKMIKAVANWVKHDLDIAKKIKEASNKEAYELINSQGL